MITSKHWHSVQWDVVILDPQQSPPSKLHSNMLVSSSQRPFPTNVRFWQPRIDTLLLNEGIPRALEGKKLRLKIPRVLPSIFELFLVFQIWGQNTIGGQYMQNIDALIFWYKYLQKVNAMPSDFWWKKKQVLLHWWIFF